MDYYKFSKKSSFIHHYLHLTGAIILIINKIRHEIRGYLTPRPFSANQIDKVIDYDLQVVSNWRYELKKYCANDNLLGLNILELGPGSDIGVGLSFLALGAKEYFALDKFKLINQTPQKLYTKLIDKIGKDEKQKRLLNEEIQLFKNNQSGRIHYYHDKNFSLKHFLNKNIDLIVSQAAFEHFTNPALIIKELGKISQIGTKVVAQIDMTTHSRWIKEVDPLNIYRYSDWFYQLTKFSGSPNRWRLDEYVREFKKAGFGNIHIVSSHTLPIEYTEDITPYLNKKFQSPEKQMGVLDGYLLATKEKI
jgi:hypothetical protein